MAEHAAGTPISIVVVAYRQREALAECLRSCSQAAKEIPGGAELIVVDNGGLADFVRDRAPSAQLIEPKRNLGFAGGVNAALARARGRWVALVNDDARIAPDSLRHLLEAGEEHKRMGAVAAQIRFHADPERINSAGIEVDSLGIATERLAGRPVMEAKSSGEVFGASGCVALYRRAMVEQLGGFEESFFAYLEDVDLAWRARAAGWKCVYEAQAVAYHHGSASSGEGSDRKYFLVGRNRVRLLARNATSGQVLRALPGILVYDTAYVVYVALAHRTLAPLRGRLAGLREWRSARHGTRAFRRHVRLGSGWQGWTAALRQHRAYLRLGSRA
ncbi:MAG: glycosyltransferase family 2 protein [Solirubrobacteraceae bacterium]